MPSVRVVQMYDTDRKPATVQFTESGLSVCELYAEGLRARGVQNRHSELRLFVDFDRQRRDVQVSVADEKEGFESARVVLPAAVTELSPYGRSLLALDVVHVAASRLGELRGWAQNDVIAARDSVLDCGLVFSWASPWKKSPNRRYEARATYRMTPDGSSRAALQIRTTGAAAPHTWSEPVEAYFTFEGFKRSAATLRWEGSEAVGLVAYSDPFGGHINAIALGVEGRPVDRSHRLDEPAHPVADEPRPAVLLHIEDPSVPQIRVIGGGSDRTVPNTYPNALDRLFDQLGSEEWHHWWRGAEVPLLEVWWAAHEGVAKTRPFVRRSREKVIARIERRPDSFRHSDPVELAREDFVALMTVVQQRMGLGPPPPLHDPGPRRRQ